MDDCPCPPKAYKVYSILSGFYAGVEGGYDSYNSSRQVIVNDLINANLHTNSSGLMGNIFGGYGYTFPHNLYLGGEVFIGSTNAGGSSTINSYGTSYNGTLSVGTSYGFGVKPGYKVENGPLIYLRLGYDRTEFRSNESTIGIMPSSSSISNWSNGFDYGLGLESKVYKNFSLRMEYNHINYSSFTNDATGTKNSPADNQGKLGLVYHFGNGF